jgi:hypothetical protein
MYDLCKRKYLYVRTSLIEFLSNAFFLGAFAKLLKATLSFVTSLRLSVSPFLRMEQFASHGTDFHGNWYLSIFRKSIKKTKVSLKADKNSGYFTWRPIYITIISRWILLRMRNVSDKICRANQHTHFMFNNSFFRKSCRLWHNTEKCGRARQATDDTVIRRMRFACWITNSKI